MYAEIWHKLDNVGISCTVIAKKHVAVVVIINNSVNNLTAPKYLWGWQRTKTKKSAYYVAINHNSSFFFPQK